MLHIRFNFIKLRKRRRLNMMLELKSVRGQIYSEIQTVMCNFKVVIFGMSKWCSGT